MPQLAEGRLRGRNKSCAQLSLTFVVLCEKTKWRRFVRREPIGTSIRLLVLGPSSNCWRTCVGVGCCSTKEYIVAHTVGLVLSAFSSFSH
jgi:hypothetical protein